jgi:hypothetical protein
MESLTAEQIVMVVEKIIGGIAPVGCSSTDAKRYENLEVMTDVAEAIISNLWHIREDTRNSYEGSVKKASMRIGSFLEILGEYAEDHNA